MRLDSRGLSDDGVTGAEFVGSEEADGARATAAALEGALSADVLPRRARNARDVGGFADCAMPVRGGSFKVGRDIRLELGLTVTCRFA
jgi:hypothetical protein